VRAESIATRHGSFHFNAAMQCARRCTLSVCVPVTATRYVPAFRDAFRKRHCLIAADGIYEWKKTGAKTKQPYYIRLKDEQPFGIAGLWERWGEIESCTILTTSSNELCATVHDRMPVILSPVDHDRWLDPAPTDPADLQPLLDAYPADEMLATPVSTLVNNVHNSDKRCIAPMDQQQLL
jgi:putative SOS response-associated peptidase YedK